VADSSKAPIIEVRALQSQGNVTLCLAKLFKIWLWIVIAFHLNSVCIFRIEVILISITRITETQQYILKSIQEAKDVPESARATSLNQQIAMDTAEHLTDQIYCLKKKAFTSAWRCQLHTSSSASSSLLHHLHLESSGRSLSSCRLCQQLHCNLEHNIDPINQHFRITVSIQTCPKAHESTSMAHYFCRIIE